MEIIDDKPLITDNKKVLQDGIYVISKEQDKFYEYPCLYLKTPLNYLITIIWMHGLK